MFNYEWMDRTVSNEPLLLVKKSVPIVKSIDPKDYHSGTCLYQTSFSPNKGYLYRKLSAVERCIYNRVLRYKYNKNEICGKRLRIDAVIANSTAVR